MIFCLRKRNEYNHDNLILYVIFPNFISYDNLILASNFMNALALISVSRFINIIIMIVSTRVTLRYLE